MLLQLQAIEEGGIPVAGRRTLRVLRDEEGAPGLGQREESIRELTDVNHGNTVVCRQPVRRSIY